MKNPKFDIGLYLIGGFILIGLILLLSGAIGAPESTFRAAPETPPTTSVYEVPAANSLARLENALDELLQWIALLGFAIYVFYNERRRVGVLDSMARIDDFSQKPQPLLWQWIKQNGQMAYAMAIALPFLFFFVVYQLSGENPMHWEWLGPWGFFALAGTLLSAGALLIYVSRVRSVRL